MITYPNISKLKKILLFKPKVSFKKGIEMTINSYKKNDKKAKIDFL